MRSNKLFIGSILDYGHKLSSLQNCSCTTELKEKKGSYSAYNKTTKLKCCTNMSMNKLKALVNCLWDTDMDIS